MKTAKQTIVAALLTVATMASGYSQMAYNCEGCPPLNARPVRNLSSVADVNGNLPANYIMTCDTMYILDRKIYAPIGSQVIIQPGVVIRAPYLGELHSPAFIVPRDAKIFANGSECCPIIFTSIDDNLDGTYPIFEKERWGGVIILGRAHNTIAKGERNPDNDAFFIGAQTRGVGFIEGVDHNDPRHWYGSEVELGQPFENNDNSGVLNYVSIRHGGSELGTANEINGLTLGSVGSRTILRNIEVISNGDDGIEWFGGTVDLKYAKVLYCEDDYLDWDQGFTGRIQHVLAVQRPLGTTAGGPVAGHHGIEADGDDGLGFPRAWRSDPIVSNVTMIGRGGGTGTGAGLDFRERTKGEIYNSIFANFNRGINYASLLPNPPGNSLDTVVVSHNTFVNNVTNINRTPVAALDPNLTAFNNTFVTSLLGFTSTNWTSIWDAIPNMTGAALNVKGLPENPAKIAAGWYAADYYDWFDAVDYRGAFRPGASPWWSMAYCPKIGGARADFESMKSFPALTDINGDGITNAVDLGALIARFNFANNQ